MELTGTFRLRFSTPTELEQVREVKENLCYVALDYEAECAKKEEFAEYKLPDGIKLRCG